MPKLALAGASTIVSLLLVELGLRANVRPSDHSSGTLFGHELPPLRVTPRSLPQEVDRSLPYRDLVVDGVSVTGGDLFGAYRSHSSIGHVPLERWASEHRWWVNNNFGARATDDVGQERTDGRYRVLILGDSFAAGNGLRQRETFANLLQESNPLIEVLNFGVPGYGMGQALLRFEEVRHELDYDLAILLFVPGVDLWRDVNVVRNVGEEGWPTYNVVPRFEVDGSQLRLVLSPYEDMAEFFAENANGLSSELRQHLLDHEYFYLPQKFEQTGVLDRSVLYKLWVKSHYDRERRALRANLMRPGSEALNVSSAIFRSMADRAASDEARFMLVVLPSHEDVRHLNERRDYATNWRSMTEAISLSGLSWLDLTSHFVGLPEADRDRAHDGTHYGLRANVEIAEMVLRALEDVVLIQSPGP